MINEIEKNVKGAKKYVGKTDKRLKKAVKYHDKVQRRKCCLLIIALLVIVFLVGGFAKLISS
jgi:t-SNARE complex subunit (syntaxin)